MSKLPEAWRWDRVRALLEHAVEAGWIPGFAARVGIRDQVLWQHVGGQAVQQGGRPRPMTEDTWFDLASLTKVMATLPSLLVLAQEGKVTFRQSVREFFPTWDARWDQVTIHHLLTHSGGLVPFRPYHETLDAPAAVLHAIQNEPWAAPPGTSVIYSDLGFILLGAIVEQVSGRPLAAFVETAVFEPLGIREARYTPDEAVKARCAATEVVAGQALQGVVHDENARAMGGVAGHAGLFATVDAVSRYAMAWAAGPSPLWSEAVWNYATRCHTTSLNGRRGWGWALRGDSYDVGGDFWPDTGAGHTGFTGTSLQFDPVSGIWAVLLTNRVHLGREVNINPLRRTFHNVVMGIVG
ncbi:MAG: serine hydrolase [Firmicutes bacterium]|nr:serine hydrolase [Bacillota bacterium]